jgi:hypothetical protein
MAAASMNIVGEPNQARSISSSVFARTRRSLGRTDPGAERVRVEPRAPHELGPA